MIPTVTHAPTRPGARSRLLGLLLTGLLLAGAHGQTPPVKPGGQPSTGEAANSGAGKPVPSRDDPEARAVLAKAALFQVPDTSAKPLETLDITWSAHYFVTPKGETVDSPTAATLRWQSKRAGDRFQCRREISEGKVRVVYVREREARNWIEASGKVRLMEDHVELQSELAFFNKESQLLELLLLLFDLPSVHKAATEVRFVARDVQHIVRPWQLRPRLRGSIQVDVLEVTLVPRPGQKPVKLTLRIGRQDGGLYYTGIRERLPDGKPGRLFAMHFGSLTRHPVTARMAPAEWMYSDDGRPQAIGAITPGKTMSEGMLFNPDLPRSLFRRPKVPAPPR